MLVRKPIVAAAATLAVIMMTAELVPASAAPASPAQAQDGPSQAQAAGEAASEEPNYQPAKTQMPSLDGLAADSKPKTPITTTFSFSIKYRSRVFFTTRPKVCVHIDSSPARAGTAGPGAKFFVGLQHWHPGHLGVSWGTQIGSEVWYPIKRGTWYGYCWNGVNTSWQLKLLFSSVVNVNGAVKGTIVVDNA